VVGFGFVEDPGVSRFVWPVMYNSTGFVGGAISEVSGEEELVLAES
jgi:hypothetical protein